MARPLRWQRERVRGSCMSQIALSLTGPPQAGLAPTRRRWWIALAGAAALAAAGGTIVARAPGLVSSSPAAQYRLAAIDAGPIVSAVTTAGTVKPRAAIQVGSQVSGQIKELL